MAEPEPASGYPGSSTSGSLTATGNTAAVYTAIPAALTMEVTIGSGTWVGSFALQSRIPGGDWTPVVDANGVVVVATTPQQRVTFGDPGYEYRLAYTKTSGGNPGVLLELRLSVSGVTPLVPSSGLSVHEHTVLPADLPFSKCPRCNGVVFKPVPDPARAFECASCKRPLGPHHPVFAIVLDLREF